MIRITVACTSGMSISLLVSKMESYAQKKKIAVSIIAVPENKFDHYLSKTDILLLGPQISFLEKKYKQKLAASSIKVAAISIIDFGRMDGEKVLDMALNLLKGGEVYE